MIFKFTFYCICVRNSVTVTSKHKTLTLEEKILPETVKKCFLKAGFPAHASADTQDVTVENLQAISDLCKQGNLPDNAEDVVNFDNELATTEDIQSAADIAAENSRCDVME